MASICPTYFALFLQGSAKTQFLRILRLLRIIRVLRLLRLLTVLEKVDVAADLIAETMRQSLLLLTVFMFFVLMYIALFGCLIFLLEQGIFVPMTPSQHFPFTLSANPFVHPIASYRYTVLLSHIRLISHTFFASFSRMFLPQIVCY